MRSPARTDRPLPRLRRHPAIYAAWGGWGLLSAGFTLGVLESAQHVTLGGTLAAAGGGIIAFVTPLGLREFGRWMNQI